MENCPLCNGELKFSGAYALCQKCDRLFVRVGETWQEYPAIAPFRPLMRQALGFAPFDNLPAIEREP